MRRYSKEKWLDVIRTESEKKGGRCLSETYQNAHIKLSFRCEYGHHFAMNANNLFSGYWCAGCAGKDVTQENSFEINFPELAKEWDQRKNEGLIPGAVTKRSGRAVWWNCPKGHSYRARIADRTVGRGCPVCRNQTSIVELRLLAELETVFDKVEHRKRFGNIECDLFIPEINLGIEIDGNFFHRDRYDQDSSKNSMLEKLCIKLLRIRGQGLKAIGRHDVLMTKRQETKPDIDLVKRTLRAVSKIAPSSKIKAYFTYSEFQSPKRFLDLVQNISNPTLGRSLKEAAPNLVKEWVIDKNLPLTPNQLSVGSNVGVWWQCKIGHEWEASPSERRVNGCPYCAGKRPSPQNNLKVLAPNLSEEWYQIRNCAVTPDQVVARSNKKFWWKCSENKDHIWFSSPNQRVRNPKCPFCSRRRITEAYSLAAVFPKLAKQWHSEKNGRLNPADVFPSTGKKYWWKCVKGHEWQQSPNSRSKSHNCPFCEKRRPSTEYNLKIIHPKIAEEWHYKKNKDVLPTDVLPSSGKKYWWICKLSHEFYASPNSREPHKPCPVCCPKPDPRRAKREIRDFYRIHHRLPKRIPNSEKKLAEAVSRYSNAKSPMFDPKFAKWVRKVGHGKNTVEENIRSIWYFSKKYGRRPRHNSENLDESRLAIVLTTYLSPKKKQYRAEFAKEYSNQFPRGDRSLRLAGVRFGRLVAVKIIGKTSKGYIWRCLCDCGQETKVLASKLASRSRTSCGCAARSKS